MSPSGLSGRLAAIDLARLVALLGMFTAHIVHPQNYRGDQVGDLLFTLAAGRSAALFAVLAGVSLALASPREVALDTPSGLRLRILVRAAWIAMIGLFLGVFPSGVAVILTYYGVLFCFALPVLRWRASHLALLALCWGLLSPLVSVLLREQLPQMRGESPHLFRLGTDPIAMMTELLVTGYYPALTWATYLFAGMAVGRVLREGGGERVMRALTLGGAATAAAAWGISAMVTRLPSAETALLGSLGSGSSPGRLAAQQQLGFYGTHPTDTWWWLGVWVPHSGSIIDLAHTTGTALLVLGALLWLVRLVPAVPWHVIGGAGGMTLTLYTAHVLVLASPLGAEGPLARGSLTGLLAHSALAVVVGAVFATVHRRGPLESVVSAATHRIPLQRHPR